MEYQFKTRTKLLEYQKEETKRLFLSVPTLGKTKATANEKLNIWKSLNTELKAQNPTYIKLQHIRKSVIVNWLKQYNLREVQYKAGHRHIYSTEMYLVNDIDDLQAEINKYHPIG